MNKTKNESEASKKARAARDKARRETAKKKGVIAKPATPPVKATAADVKRHERLATAAIGKPPAKASKPAPAKKAAKKAVKPVKAAKTAKKAAKVGKSALPKPLPASKPATKQASGKSSKAGKPSATNTRLPKSAATSTPKPARSIKPGLKVVTGHKAGTLPGDETANGVLMPREGTQARKLWVLCDSLKKKLGRPPARFEFREAIQSFKGTDGNSPINPDSASFQYFAWRKFYGVKGRSIGIYPKRNTFEANTPVAPQPAKKAAKAKK